MKKKIFTFSLLFFLVLIVSASADSIHAGKIGLGGHFAWYEPNEVEESTLFYGVHTRFRLSPHFAIEGSIDYYTEEVSSNTDFILYPIQASLLVYLINSRIIEAHITGGAGWFFWKFDGPGMDDDGSELSYHAGAGLELPLANSFSLHADIRWVYFKPDIEWSDYDDWSGIWSTLGFSFYL